MLLYWGGSSQNCGESFRERHGFRDGLGRTELTLGEAFRVLQDGANGRDGKRVSNPQGPTGENGPTGECIKMYVANF